MYVHHLCALKSWKRGLDLLELVMSHHRFGEPNLGPLQGGKCSNH